MARNLVIDGVTFDLEVNDGTSVGVVERETISINANVDVMSIPLTAPEGAYALDFNGAQADISIEGTISCTTQAIMQTQAIALKALVTGSQSLGYYTSELIGSGNIKIQNIDLRKEAATHNSFRYTIKMTVCDPTI